MCPSGRKEGAQGAETRSWRHPPVPAAALRGVSCKWPNGGVLPYETLRHTWEAHLPFRQGMGETMLRGGGHPGGVAGRTDREAFPGTVHPSLLVAKFKVGGISLHDLQTPPLHQEPSIDH